MATFFTMAYIIVLNPLILGLVQDGTGQYLGGGSSPDLGMIAAGTALVAGVMTIAMGAIANFPLALAAGLGLNAFVAFSVAALPGMTWADAMGLIVVEGVIILLLVLTGFREAVFHAIPAELKTAISVGIGLFITLVGLADAGIVSTGEGTPLTLGVGGSLMGLPSLVFVIGLFAIIVMTVRRVKGAILYGIIGSTVLAVIVEAVFHVGSRTGADGEVVNPGGWGLNVPAFPNDWLAVPHFGTLGQFNLLGSFEKLGLVTMILLVFSLMLADFFDTMGTMVAVGAEAELLDEEGNPPNTRSILVVDSAAAMVGGMGGVSSNTSFIESTSGVAEGARTGLAAVVTGIMFLLATFLSPLVNIVPSEAATPALVVVGFLMMQQVAGISWNNLELSVPAFLTIVLMPFTYSISVGIGAGFIAYMVIQVAVGKARALHPLMWLISLLFVVYFTLTPLRALLGA